MVIVNSSSSRKAGKLGIFFRLMNFHRTYLKVSTTKISGIDPSGSSAVHCTAVPVNIPEILVINIQWRLKDVAPL